MNAGLVLRPEEHEIGLAAFQTHRIIALDFHYSILRAALRDAVTKGEIVADVENRQGEEGYEENAFPGRLTVPGLDARSCARRLLSFPYYSVQSIMAMWGGETRVLNRCPNLIVALAFRPACADLKVGATPEFELKAGC